MIVNDDDQDPNFAVTSGSTNCYQEARSEGYNGQLHYSTTLSGASPSCAVRWSVPVADTRGGPGTYEVYTHIPDQRRNETRWATYQIQHQGVTSQAIVDQSATGGQWVLLGKYRFNWDWDSAEQVTLSNATIDTTTLQIAFDAVMFAPASDGPMPTPTPGPTPTPEPVTAIIDAPLGDLSRPSFLDENGHSSSVTGSIQAPTDPDGRQFFRFNPTDDDVERVTFYPNNNDLALGGADTPDQSFTVDLMFCPAVGVTGEHTLANALWNGGLVTQPLGGWKLGLDTDTHMLAFAAYNAAGTSTIVTIPLSYDSATPPWMRVKAIKDGVHDRLYLCTRVGTGIAEMTQGVPFAGGVYYWPGTTVDLGADFRATQEQPLDPNTSWNGDLDQFLYKSGIDLADGCTIPPTPTPTRTPTSTSTPIPWTPLPAATIVHLPMNEGFGTPLADWAGQHTVAPNQVTVVPGYSATSIDNGNARHIPQATSSYSRISLGKSEDYYSR